MTSDPSAPACGDIPDLASLVRCLQAEADRNGGRFVELGAGLFAAAGTLAGYLDPAKPLRLEKAEGKDLVQPGDGEVTVAGNAALFPGAVAHAVSVVGRVPAANDVRLRLEAVPADEKGWSLSAAFPGLPKYYGIADPPKLLAAGAPAAGTGTGVAVAVAEDKDGLVPTGPSLQWQASFFGDTVLKPRSAGAPLWIAATFQDDGRAPGLRLQALLDASQGTLGKRVGPYLPAGDRSSLPLDGTVAVRAAKFPLVRLAAPVQALQIDRVAGVALVLSTRDRKGDPDGESLAELDGRVQLGDLPALHVSGPVLKGDLAWVLTVAVEDPEKYTLARGLDALAKFAGVPSLTLPAGLDAFASFYLASVTVGLAPRSGSAVPTVLGVSIGSTARWVLPLPGFSIGEVGTAWEVVNPFGKPMVSGSVSGTVFLGEGDQAPRLAVDVGLTGLTGQFAPDVTLRASLDRRYPLRVDRLFNQFTGMGIDLDLRVSEMDLEAQTGPRTFTFTALLENNWQPLAPLFEFRSLALDFNYAPNGWTGSIAGVMAVATLPFDVKAAYRGAGEGWLFSGGLLPSAQPVSLQSLVNGVAGERYPDLPANLGKIELRRLRLSFDTKSREFGFDGVAGWPFDFPDLGLKLDIEAELNFKSRPGTTLILASGATDLVVADAASGRVYEGFVRGTLKVNDFSVSVIYTFDVEKNRTLTFAVRYRNLTLLCVLSKNKQGQTILRAGLSGVSFGDMVEYLVGLVDPQLGFRLAAPWDVLYQIRFDDLKLEVNFATKAVGFRYEPRVNLGIVQLDAISLTYLKRAGRSTVDIAVEGDFLGQKYDEDRPLSWDLLNDPPPSPPGKAEQLLDLRFLGLGQNVTFRETESFRRVRDVIARMEADFAEVEGDENPLATLPALKFSGDGSWLVGADFTVMSAVSLMGVFNDPVLYGLRVGLAGEKVKSLAGLEFEILYKKVTDTLGVYSLELTLPDAMRQLQFGAVSVTVPIIGIDIYTNGNFRLDLGFPVNRDFSRSFCVQAGPFIGYGGFYFALLDGASSSVVPRVRNGSFAPVIEAGLGLSLGVGRTLDKGVLKAGATLTVQAIIEGALAWFNPDDRGQPTALFYRVQGTASIVGKVYGEVDFVVIKARLSITVRAAVTLTLQAYEPILVLLELEVEVSASVTILFIEITFSFQAKLDLSFKIGEGSTAPWLPAAEEPREHPLRLGGQRRRFRARPPAPLELFRLLRERTGEAPEFDWSPRAVFADGAPVDVDVLLVPSLTPAIASRVTHALRAAAETPSGDPAVQVVMSLVVPTSTPAGARHAHEVLRVEHEAAEDAAFNRLAAGVLRWAISSLRAAPDAHVFRSAPAGAGESVTAAALEAIACFLADRANREATFTYERVTGLIGRNFVLRVSNPIGPTGAFHDPRSDAPRAVGAPNLQGAVFPMIPEVRMAPQGQPTVEFWKHACADADYRAFLASYYDQLTPPPPAGAARDPFERDPCPRPGPTGLASSGPLRSAPLPAGCAAGREPLSAVLFVDYFAMVAQQGVQAAVELMGAYPYEPTGAESLLDVARAFGGFRVEYATRPGDTPATVAAAFGVSVDEVRRLNAGWLEGVHHAERLPHGSVLAVEVGPTVARIAAANPDYPLKPGAKLTVRHARYAVKAKETLSTIARSFALEGAQALVAVEGPGADNAANPALLRAGVELPVPPADYRVEAGDLVVPAQAVDRIAANHFVRGGLRAGGAEVEARVAWYASAIGRLNGGSFQGTIKLPVAEMAGDPPQLRDTGAVTEYVVSATDTVAGVAATFELLQISRSDPAWTEFRGRVTVTPPGDPVAGSIVHLPALAYRLRAGDTLEALSRLFLAPRAATAPAAALEALARSAGGAELLAPRAVLALPDVHYPVREGDTLATVAQRFDQTVEEVADGAKSDAGILAAYDGKQRMGVPDVAARPVDDLVRDLARFGRFNTLSTTLSRFLVNGMRAPVPPAEGPVPPDAPLWGVYDVAGQQFPAPGTTGPYEIAFSKGSTAAWFCFEPPAGERAAAEGCADALKVTLPDFFFTKHAPSVRLDPLLATGPAPLRLYDLAAPRHAMEQVLPWLPAAQVPLPGPTAATGASGQVTAAAGGPSLWMFPQTLLREIAAGPTGVTAGTRPYELLAARDTRGGGTAESTLGAYAWATAVPLRITRARDEGGGFVPGAYELAGADQDGRDRLLKAWRYLEATPGHPDRLYLLYRPGGADANRQGLVSDVLSGGRTLLLKTNLSTETHSNALLAAPGAGSGDFHAALATPGAFLRYAWEASITGTGGFHLTYAATDGAAIPDALFAADGSATLWVVLLLDRQSRPGAPERALYAFNNCAVLAENLDASAVRVVARLRDPAPAELVRVAAVPPGVVGFGLARHNPHGASGPTGLTQRLHSLVGYQVKQSDDFAGSHEGLPIGPQDRGPAWMGLPPRGPTAHAYWAYEQVIPIARFGAVNDCPRSPALPGADANPYRGITGPSQGTTRPLSTARVALAYHDVYGNETTATQPLPELAVPVGYTDDLVGTAAWPGSAFDYRFAPGPTGGIVLDTALSLQADRYLPGAGNAYQAAVRAAGADAERYGGVFYQVQQRDVAFALASNLGSPRVDDAGLVKAPLLGFVVKARAFADAAGTLRQRTHATPGGQTLAALADALAVTPPALLAANRDADAAALFPATWVRPHLVPAPAMSTLTALAREVGGRRTGFVPGRNPCAGVAQPDAACAERPAGLRLVLPGEEARSLRAAPRAALAGAEPDAKAVARDNAAQPLTPGTVLRTRSRTSPPLGFTSVTNSLDGVAAWLGCAVYAEVVDPAQPGGAPLRVGLLVDDWEAPGIVANDVVVTAGGATHRTRDDTFKTVYDALVAQLGAQGLGQGDFAQAVRPVEGIFVAGKTLAYATLAVPQPGPSPLPGPASPVFALRDVPAEAGTPEELGDLNRAVAGFFFTGSPLLLGFDCCKAGEHDTPGTLAEDARITLDQLAEYNLGVEVGAGVELEIPGLVHLPDPDAVWASYAPKPEDSLASVAAALGVDARALAGVNRELPGVFAPGAAVRIGGVERRAAPMDSLESMWKRFGGEGGFEAFVDQLAPQGGIYSPAGAFLGPLPRVPDGGDGRSPALETVAAALNLTPAALLGGNRALAGFLREGATILGPQRPDGTETSVTVGAFDTVETVRRRLRDQLGPAALPPTDAELAALNARRPGLLGVGARLLPPPVATPLVVPFDAALPHGAGEGSLIFPVEVTLAMTRAPGLVHPDFRDAESVRRAESRLAPRIPAGEAAAELTLVPFAQSFEAAFAPHRLKCAVAAGADRKPGALGEVWAVNFGPTGIRRVEVDPSRPRFYALRPLSTETVGGEVRIPVYTSGHGLCGSVSKRFEGVDLDVWMRQLLDTVDLYLTPPYSVPAFRLGLTGAAAPAPAAAIPGLSPLAVHGAAAAEGPVGLVSGRPPTASVLAAEPLVATGPTGCTGPTPSGPADFDRIVRAKDALAKSLRQNVMPVLDTPGATGTVYHEAARDALYQQMLVRLGEAYDVSAVVQFPVNVESPIPTRTEGPYPPRASGKVVPAVYTISAPRFGAVGPPRQPAFALGAARAAGGSLPESYEAVAGVFGVAAPFLAQVTGDMEGLLREGGTIDGEPVRSHDTLNRVAARRGVPTDPAAPGYWKTWQEFVARFAAEPVFVPGAAFPLSRTARAAAGGDTFTVFAEFFGRGLDSVARANQGLAGILRAGSLVADQKEFPNPYDVRDTDTLADVAAGVSRANGGRPLDVDRLAVLLRDRAVLRPGAELRMADPLPEMSISTAKVSLGPVGASGGPPPPLSFLLTVKHAAERDKLLLNLDYAINEVEYAIRDVPGAGGYQASRWLTLVLPLDRSRGGIDAGVRTAVPQVQVPIPLRAYPPPSRLVGQSGVPAEPGAGDFVHARKWDYRFDVQTRKAAQDTDHLRVTFGEPPGMLAASAVSPELIRWLAAFTDAYPRLKDDLARLPDLEPGAQDPVAAYAVQSLSLLAERVAGALGGGFLQAAGGGSAADTYRYRMTTLADGTLLSTLRLDPESERAGFRLAAPEAGPRGASGTWPLVFVKSTTGGGETGPEPGFLPMEGGEGFYTYPPGFRVDETLTYRFRFDGRDVIRNSTGRGAIAVSRNDRLVAHGPLGPTGGSAPVPTANDFIYRTPFVEFVDPLVPLIDNDAAIDVAGGSGPRPLGEHLLSLLRQATDVTPGGGAPQTIEMLCSYGFPLAGTGDGALVATTPILLVPSRPISPGDVGAFATELAASLNDWHRSSQVTGDDGRLVFALSVFTTGAEGGALPILRFRNLQLPVRAVQWGGAPKG